MNRWMLQGLDLAQFSAINVSAQDIAGLVAAPPTERLPLVSANVTGPQIAPAVRVQRAGLRIGITGISAPAPSLADTRGYAVAPIAAAEPVLAELVAAVDVVVLLAWSGGDAARELVRKVPGVDLVVESATLADAPAAAFMGRSLFAFGVFQTVQAGEIRLRVVDGSIRGAVDRHIDLDGAIPDDPALYDLGIKARAEIDAVQKELYGL
jgi:hypothetical protein